MHGPIETMLTTAGLADRRPFKIGVATICPATRTVAGPGGSVQVEPRIMQVLLILADAEGGVVTRDLLFARCWGGVIVGDDSLNRAIAGVRKLAIGVAGASFEIETVTRTGYRLVGDVRPIEIAEETAGSAGPPRWSVTRRVVLGGTLAAAGVGGLALWGMRNGKDPAAELMDQARVAMRASTPEQQRRAVGLLERSVAVAPRSAAAWGLLALTRARVDEHAMGRPVTSANLVEEAAGKALNLHPGNADAKAALAVAIPYYGDWLTAERRFDGVLAEHPGHLFTRDSRSFLLGAVGRMREGARDRLAFSSGMEFDADLQNRLTYAYWFLDRIADADRVAARGLEMWPRNPALWFARLWVLAGTGRLDRALSHVADVSRRPPLPSPMLATLRAALLAASSGRTHDVDAASAMVMAGVARSVSAVVNGLMLLNLMGATDRAFALARAYYLEQGPIIAAMDWRPGQPFVPDQRRRKTNMLFTPIATAMQKDPRFPPLMGEMGLTNYWLRRGVRPDFLV